MTKILFEIAKPIKTNFIFTLDLLKTKKIGLHSV